MSKKPILFLVAAVMCTIAAIPLTGCTERRDEGNGAAEYTVNFDLSCTVDGQEVWSTVNGEREAESVTITEGSAFLNKLPALDAREDNYTFVGWYYINEDTNIRVTEATVFDPAVFVGAENNTITLCAVCSDTVVTVKFNLAYEIDGKTVYSTVGGETSVPDAKIADGMTFGSILPEVDTRPMEDDYYFAGWYYVVGGTSIKIESDTVFTRAQFFDGGSGNEITLVARLGKAWIGPY